MVTYADDLKRPVDLTECLEALEDMALQHCNGLPKGPGGFPADDAWYDTGALTANAVAFWILVRAGRWEFELDDSGQPVGVGRRWFARPKAKE